MTPHILSSSHVFCPVGSPFACLHCAEAKFIYYFFSLHLTQVVCFCQIHCGFASFSCVSLPRPSLPCPPPLGSIPGYFPIRMSSLFWERVCLLPLTLSSSHTGCLTAPSTTFCMKAPVSTFTLVTKPVFLTNFVVLKGFVCHTSCCCHTLELHNSVARAVCHYPHLFKRLCCHVVRLCCGPDASGEVCSGHCMWNGLLTHA